MKTNLNPFKGTINIITFIFIMLAIQLYAYSPHDVYGAAYLVAFFALWALVCIYVQKYILKKEERTIPFYLTFIFTGPAIIILIPYLLDLIGGFFET